MMSKEEEAKKIRIQWMQEMGLNEEEIADAIEFDPPISVAEEQEQLDAVHRLQGRAEPSVEQNKTFQEEMTNVRPLRNG